jgi:hypothetical protein
MDLEKNIERNSLIKLKIVSEIYSFIALKLQHKIINALYARMIDGYSPNKISIIFPQ